MKKTNYHTHTKRCMHAEGTEADYVKTALDAGLDVLGFSDHGPFPDNRFDSRMPYADLDEYLACMDALRPTVPFPILKGLEIEYCPDSRDYYSFLLKEKKLDYLLLGQHYYQEDDGSYVHVFSIPEKSVRADISNMPIPSKKRWKPDASRFSRIPMYFSTIPIPGMTTARRPVISS